MNDKEVIEQLCEAGNRLIREVLRGGPYDDAIKQLREVIKEGESYVRRRDQETH